MFSVEDCVEVVDVVKVVFVFGWESFDVLKENVEFVVVVVEDCDDVGILFIVEFIFWG